MRLALAIGVIAVTLAAAVYKRDESDPESHNASLRRCRCSKKS